MQLTLSLVDQETNRPSPLKQQTPPNKRKRRKPLKQEDDPLAKKEKTKLKL